MSTTAPWIDGLTIGAALRQTARKDPDRQAVVFPRLSADGQPLALSEGSASPAPAEHPGYQLTYRQYDEQVDRVARSLIALGIEKGQHVAVWATNWPQWALLQFATARIGAVLVTINPAYRSSELAYVLKQSDAAALFLIDHFRKSDYLDMLTRAVPQLADSQAGELNLPELPHLRHVVAIKGAPTGGMWSWEQFLQQGESVAPDELTRREEQLQPGDAINIQYTSGTTGFPKGATLTHRNLLMNAYYIGDCQRFSHEDRVCVPVPFYHCFGCVLGVLSAAVYGATLIVPAEHFDPQATLDAIESHRATAIYGVPTMFIAMLDHPTFAGRDLKSLRTGIMAGSPCPIEVMKRVVNDMGAAEVTIAYGLTEASPVITQTRTDDPLDLRVTTVGRPIPGIEVKVVDPATGAVLGDNEQGELCTRGHVVMLGYYNMPEATEAAIDADGWLHSGDLAVRMPNGYYRITGRIKDMVCRGGENIYPREIEEFLYTHPAVQDVAVVGVPDTRFVEELACWIRLKPDATVTEDEIRRFCRENLAHYKVPRYVKFVTEFPQTVTGKIQKFKIREAMIEELGLKQAETA
jgi:fatty-acyl-CoA synthase